MSDAPVMDFLSEDIRIRGRMTEPFCCDDPIAPAYFSLLITEAVSTWTRLDANGFEFMSLPMCSPPPPVPFDELVTNCRPVDFFFLMIPPI